MKFPLSLTVAGPELAAIADRLVTLDPDLASEQALTPDFPHDLHLQHRGRR